MVQIEYKKVDDIIPYINNANKHTDEQINKIASSIKNFGFLNPIIIDKDNEIIAGHGRLMAAKKLGIDKVPTIKAENLTDAQVKAYRIADNRLAEDGEWDEELLKVELKTLEDKDFDIDLTGFTKKEIDEMGLLQDEKTDSEKEVDDVVPEAEETPVIKLGDFIEIGQNFQHRLFCGDSTKEEDVRRLIGESYKNSKVHCISDPPYGIKYDSIEKKFGVMKNDDAFLDFIPLVKKYTNGFFFMWTSYQVVDEWIRRVKKEFGKITNMIIWHKGGGGIGDCKRTLATDFEIGLVVNRGNRIQSRRKSAFWDFQQEEKKAFVENAERIELIEILNELIDGDVIWEVSKDKVI